MCHGLRNVSPKLLVHRPNLICVESSNDWSKVGKCGEAPNTLECLVRGRWLRWTVIDTLTFA